MAGKEAERLPFMPERLKELRLEYGWTLDDVARQVGVTQAAVVSNWEATNQRRRTPELVTLLILQRWYGVSLDYLIGQPDADRDSPAVKVGKRALRERLRVERDLGGVSPRDRAQVATQLAVEVAPEAFFVERMAAYFNMTSEEFSEVYENGFWSPRLIDRLTSFLGLDREWFFSPEPLKVLEASQ